MRLSHYHALADLFAYPDAEFPLRARAAKDAVDGQYSAATEALERFLELLPASDLILMQELYIRSFDVQAMTTLDIGYVLFGDDYKRASCWRISIASIVRLITIAAVS